ncbi:hypothetical protein SCHPADRAFT_829144 [Schizopora paradoxa]|uniref:F-box domain-containing protein n=1 Tax=Schizopora paradoxa TaxID=27342 RepID=A0A0H2RLF7_9AGAM|nr:hypothetical protein SCHPADRAFT_829144 [Schizopora paradoxa]
MDKFATLEPVKLYAPSTPSRAAFLGGFSSSKSNANANANRGQTILHLVGRLPTDLHLHVLEYLAIPDIPAYSRACRAFSEFARDERVWETKWGLLNLEALHLDEVVDELEKIKQPSQAIDIVDNTVDDGDDDFGDFASASSTAHSNTMNNPQSLPLQGGGLSLSSHPAVLFPETSSSSKPTFRSRFIRLHALLRPYLPHLLSPPHLVLTSLFPPSPPPPPLVKQAQIIHLIARYLAPSVAPVRQHATLASSLRAAIDRFQASLLSAFDRADTVSDYTGDDGQEVSGRDENTLREAARASWEVWEGRLPSLGSGGSSLFSSPKVSDWEMGRVWCEKREIFYEQGRWKPLDNITSQNTLDFDAMDEFMTHILTALRKDGSTAVRVFPPDSFVVLSFAERVANEVASVAEYVAPLLTRAREISNEAFLKATAATFREVWRIVDELIKLNDEALASDTQGKKSNASVPYVTRNQAEDVIFQMFEANMDEYLDEEVESVNQAFEVINREWEKKVGSNSPNKNPTSPSQARFLGSHNPAQVKRTVLASFTDVLLLPVTIVPRTVGAVGSAITAGGMQVGNAAVQGIGMLNPQRWAYGGGAPGMKRTESAYKRDFGEDDGEMIFEIGDDEEEGVNNQAVKPSLDIPPISSGSSSIRSVSPAPSTTSTAVASLNTNSDSTTLQRNASTLSFEQMELQLSLDIALELIHADRDALKRLETFASYPGNYGHRVRETIEEVFILLLRSMGERHVCPGFERATEQMKTYKPAEHEATTSVAPLMQFFELVHIGDTIQSIVQVFFDKELAPHIDKTDFLNAVVREKKHFENLLDDSVAAGMNSGTEVLMNQVEHIILTQTKAREYYPPEDAPLDLGPTKGCTEAIACLDMHCKLLKGSTSKEVLEVFYQEVGIRLIGILHRHIKRQIISLQGGFQVIADLNTYHAFITSLKVAAIATDFASLKMLGHVYVVEDAKDLAQIVRDVTRYGGSYRPEDIYEFIQRRADWKKIEKTVDKAMYNLSFKEDCIVC